MTTIYIGSRQTVYLNTYDVIKEAFVENGNLFAGRPQDFFYLKELCGNIGMRFILVKVNKQRVSTKKCTQVTEKVAFKCTCFVKAIADSAELSADHASLLRFSDEISMGMFFFSCCRASLSCEKLRIKKKQIFGNGRF